VSAGPVAVDHIVVAAASLDAGIAWCRETFGLVPDAGGAHAFMGTHNRIFSVASARFPRAYLEVIAIDPAAAAPAGPRWFDLDDPSLRASIADGPQLIHWAARCTDLAARLAELRAMGCDPGDATAAERLTPKGWLRWQITIRADGHLPCGGACPTLIQWGEGHPSDSLAPSGVALIEVALGTSALRNPAGAAVGAGLASWLAGAGPRLDESQRSPLRVVFETARGRVTLESR
jgi:hypothetical protein